MADGPRKASDAVALFGRSGLQLIPLLNKGREGILEWEAAVDRLGPKIGEEAVAANEKYRKSVTELGLSWDKVKVDVEQSVVPALAKATSFLANNFESIKAGLAGGFAAGDILAKQQATQAATTAEAKEQSAAKEESLRKQEELNASQQKNFEILKAGGQAAYALEQARLSLQGAVENGLWAEAGAIQSQLPGLEKAAALEKLRAENATRLADSYAKLQNFFDSGAVVKPLQKIAPADPTKGIEALFGPQEKNPLEGSPDLGQPEFVKNASLLPDVLKAGLDRGKEALDAFYASWNAQARGTVESINADYDAQENHFRALLDLGEISQAQFNDVSLKLEKQRQDGLKKLRQDTGVSTWRDAWEDLFTKLEQDGKDFARSLTQDIGGAIESLNQSFARMIATGKSIDFKAIGQQFTENIVSSVLKKGESSLFGSLGNFLGFGSSKADGSSANNALWVQLAGNGLSLAGASGLGSLPLGGLDGLWTGRAFLLAVAHRTELL